MKGIRGFRRIVLIVNLLLFGKLVLAQSQDEIVGKLMNEQNMFELRDKHSEHQQHLSPMINYFAEAMLAEAFNRPEKGIEAIDSLLNNEVLQQQLGLDNITYLIYLKANFLESQWRYSEETEMLSSFLSQTKELPIRNDLKTTLERYLRVASLLQNAPQTVMQRPQTDVIVKYEEEYFTKGLSLLIPCLLNGKSIDMVLDTGNPKHTVVSAKLAKELNVTILVDSIPMRGVGNGYGKIGIADRLQIEEISIENPLLYVVDGISSIDTMPIDAVLGSEVLNALGEVQILTKNKQIVFPQKLEKCQLVKGNLIMNNMHLYFRLNQDTEKVLMHFDTGASVSNMSNHYYLRNEESIKQVATIDSIRLAGFGGVSKHLGYLMPKMRFSLDNKEFTYTNLSVHTEDVMNMWNEDGCFGADFLQKFEKVTLSYKNMFIQVQF